MLLWMMIDFELCGFDCFVVLYWLCLVVFELFGCDWEFVLCE